VTTILAAPGTPPQAPEQAALSLPGCLPARSAAADWPATRLVHGPARDQLSRPPFTREVASSQETRARGLARLLDWLAGQPGATWQERWLASGAEEAGADWAQLPIRWLHDRRRRSQWLRAELATALGAVICADLIRPSLGWLVFSLAGKGALGRDLAQARDPAGFARMRELCAGDPRISKAAADMALRRTTLILAAKGGTIADITVGDVLEILGAETSARSASVPGGEPALGVAGTEAARGQDFADAVQVGGGELEAGGGDVLLDPLRAAGSGDRHDVVPLGQQPGEGEL
jgi:hypothetical protein